MSGGDSSSSAIRAAGGCETAAFTDIVESVAIAVALNFATATASREDPSSQLIVEQQSDISTPRAGPALVSPKQQGIFAQKPTAAVAGASPETITITSNARTFRAIESDRCIIHTIRRGDEAVMVQQHCIVARMHSKRNEEIEEWRASSFSSAAESLALPRCAAQREFRAASAASDLEVVEVLIAHRECALAYANEALANVRSIGARRVLEETSRTFTAELQQLGGLVSAWK